MSYLIVADDHTGACDAGSAFAQRGWPVEVFFAASPDVFLADGVAAVSLGVRSLEPAEALARTEEFCRTLESMAGRRLLVKIDSTLAPGSAVFLSRVASLLGPRMVVVAPANPAQGRMVVNGELVVKGVRSGVRVAEWAGLEGVAAAVFPDAECDGDLDGVVAEAPADALLVGSAGLAAALARAGGAGGGARSGVAARPKADGAIHVVAGSRQEITREQVGALREAALAEVSAGVELPAREWLHGGRGLIVIGGDTLQAVTPHFGITRLRLARECVGGVSFGWTANGAVVGTKPGGFGKRNTLIEAVRFLRGQA